MTKVKSEFKSRRREATASVFVDAAEETIAAKGYDSATMADIARVAGCASGTLYLYFKSKEELFNAMVAKHMVAITEMLGGVMRSDLPPLEKLRRKIEFMLEYFNAHRKFFRIFYTVGPGGRINLQSHLHDSALEAYTNYKKIELTVIQQAQTDGAIRNDLPAQELLEFMHGIHVATLARWSLSPPELTKEEQFDRLWRLLTGGLCGAIRSG